MKRFVAELNDHSYVNVTADRMEIVDCAIRVYCSGELVAFLDVSCVLIARMDEKVKE